MNKEIYKKIESNIEWKKLTFKEKLIFNGYFWLLFSILLVIISAPLLFYPVYIISKKRYSDWNDYFKNYKNLKKYTGLLPNIKSIKIKNLEIEKNPFYYDELIRKNSYKFYSYKYAVKEEKLINGHKFTDSDYLFYKTVNYKFSLERATPHWSEFINVRGPKLNKKYSFLALYLKYQNFSFPLFEYKAIRTVLKAFFIDLIFRKKFFANSRRLTLKTDNEELAKKIITKEVEREIMSFVRKQPRFWKKDFVMFFQNGYIWSLQWIRYSKYLGWDNKREFWFWPTSSKKTFIKKVYKYVNHDIRTMNITKDFMDMMDRMVNKK